MGLLEEQYHHAFSSMLKENALHIYYDNIIGKDHNFETMEEKVGNIHETDEIKMENQSQ